MLDEEARPLPRHSSSFRVAPWRGLLARRSDYLNAEQDARPVVLAVGVATLFFGFLASLLVNLYLVATNDPVVHELRTVLSFKSAILGDGFVLPLLNMAAASYLFKHRQGASRSRVVAALLLGGVVTAYVHIVQAANELVNWSMPTPWHWNGLGLLHAAYMFAVVSLLWLFLLVVIKVADRPTTFLREARVVLAGVLLFLFLLRLDYVSTELSWLPSGESAYRERAGSAIAASLEAIGIGPR